VVDVPLEGLTIADIPTDRPQERTAVDEVDVLWLFLFPVYSGLAYPLAATRLRCQRHCWRVQLVASIGTLSLLVKGSCDPYVRSEGLPTVVVAL